MPGQAESDAGGHISTEPRINERIRVPEVRLVGPTGEQIGIVAINDALRLAQEADLDLVEVAPTARPPVARLMDFGKFKYESALKARESRKNQTQTVIKEIKLRPKIDPHDYGTKKGHVERFLKQGDKVKVTIMFRGREQSRPELGYKLLQRLAGDIGELGFVESAPKQDGRNMIMVIGPTKRKADARAERPAPTRASARAAAAQPAAAEAGQVSAAPAAQPRPAQPADAPAAQPRPAQPATASPRPASPRPSAPRPGTAAQAAARLNAAATQTAPRPAADQPDARPAAAQPAQRPAAAQSAPRPAAPRPSAPRPAAPRPSAPRPGAPRPAAPRPSAPRQAAAQRPAGQDRTAEPGGQDAQAGG
ncbi:MAG TPA: translation initiation factor IF-3 [Streptosporangiaceae bacterium]